MIAFSAEDYPLVLLNMGGADRTEDDLRRMFASFHGVNAHARTSKTRYVVVAMTRQSPNAQERRIIADEANRFSAQDRALCSTAILIVQSSLVRGVVTALGWLMPSFGSIIEVAPDAGRAIELASVRLKAQGALLEGERARRVARWFGASTEEGEAASGRSR
jgi:hypothetical protein